MALFNQTHCSVYVVFEVCNKLKTVKIVDLRWRRDGKDQICKLQGHEAGGAEWDTMRRGFVFSAGSNMLTRVHLSIRGGDSDGRLGGTSCSMEGAQVGGVVVVMSGRQETLLASQQGPIAVFFGLEM